QLRKQLEHPEPVIVEGSMRFRDAGGHFHLQEPSLIMSVFGYVPRKEYFAGPLFEGAGGKPQYVPIGDAEHVNLLMKYQQYKKLQMESAERQAKLGVYGREEG